MRVQGSNDPGAKTVFAGLWGVWALWGVGIGLLIVLASPIGSAVQQLAIVACVLSAAAIIWAVYTTLSAVAARQNGRPGTGRVDAIAPVFALHSPLNWHQGILDRSKARLVFTDNFGKQHKTLAHPRAYFGRLKVGGHVGVHVGKKRTWWNGDIGYRRTKTSSKQPAAQTE